MVTVSALLQIVSYAFVVFYSILVGSIDYVLPAKVAYVTTIVFLAILPINDLNKAYNNRKDLSEVGVSLFRLAGEIIAIGALLTGGAFFVFRPIFVVDLTSLGLEVKGLVSLGIVTSLIFPIRIAYNLTQGFRRKDVPVLSPQPNATRVEDEK